MFGFTILVTRFDIFLCLDIIVGLALCLTWNIVAVTTAWIKGGGEFMLVLLVLAVLQYKFCC